MNGLRVAPYQPEEAAEAAAIAEICIRTALAGESVSGLYLEPALVPEVFAMPYLVHDPALAFVLRDEETEGERIVGYVLATADSRVYADWFRDEWWPLRRRRYFPSAREHPDETRIREAAQHPHAALPPVDERRRFPAHLHIDLLPLARGRGAGRQLMAALFGALGDRGVPGVHLNYGAGNRNAAAFYARLGFTSLPSGTPEAPRLARAVR
ncbi:acetyltransferase [Leifsonia xyli subsp. xyli str. CTCB07]|uniref:Acetyltransferase n=1 Tax=Leifsonia xyli subsp. xyli (strain CTCB07) TaxID=281090 RepID=Q6ADP9_LEIXX|nr:GNAT family N-acetyltransferase [Leifsonia xyli]AAT89497.1 acetyltransferase [Leifsonia xyli subsp. xyli str. CTCB07]